MQSAEAGESRAASRAPIRRMVLSAPGDPSGPWLRNGLRQRGLDDICLISIDALVYSTSLTHCLSPTGAAAIEIVTSEGVIGPELQATVNRAESLPLRHLEALNPADREYATGELYALFTSILYGLPGSVVNRAGPRGLAGPILRRAEWAAAAASAGLECLPLRWPPEPNGTGHGGNSRRLFAVGSEVLAAPDASPRVEHPPDHVAAGCQRLAKEQAVDLLAVDFEVEEGRWLFTGACCMPDLRLGGPPFLNALAAILQ